MRQLNCPAGATSFFNSLPGGHALNPCRIAKFTGMKDLQKHIAQLREDFMSGELRETDVDSDPALQFRKWLQQAVDAKVNEVQAMHLATVSAAGRPSSRIVYLREFEGGQYCFYTNYGSHKGKDLVENPQAALTFFWPELERQVRIEGSITKAPAAQSDAYYNSRPYASKIGAWASEQSRPLGSREELEKAVEALKQKMPPDTIRRPDFWGGYVLKADYYEFWQGRKSRLHDRISYRAEDGNWAIARLAP